jgi:hypothetical protein
MICPRRSTEMSIATMKAKKHTTGITDEQLAGIREHHAEKRAALQAVARGAFEAWLDEAADEILTCSGKEAETVSIEIYLHSATPEAEPSVSCHVVGEVGTVEPAVTKRIAWELEEHAQALGLNPTQLIAGTEDKK